MNDGFKSLLRLEPGFRVLGILDTWDKLPALPAPCAPAPKINTERDLLLLSRKIILPAIGLRPWDINNNFHIQLLNSFQISLIPTKHKWSTSARMSSIHALPFPVTTPSASASAQVLPCLLQREIDFNDQGQSHGSAATVSFCLSPSLFSSSFLGLCSIIDWFTGSCQ